MKKIILALSILAFLSAISVPFVYAEEWPPTAPEVTMDSPIAVVTLILNWFFGFVVIIAAIMIIAAGFIYVTSSGNAEKVKTAMNTLIYALIGLAVAILAKGLVFMVCKFLMPAGSTCNFF
jgi:low temperature requirement protein LtrA